MGGEDLAAPCVIGKLQREIDRVAEDVLVALRDRTGMEPDAHLELRLLRRQRLRVHVHSRRRGRGRIRRRKEREHAVGVRVQHAAAAQLGGLPEHLQVARGGLRRRADLGAQHRGVPGCGRRGEFF